MPKVGLLSLENAIDRRPLTVDPQTEVKEAIAIMGKAKSSCVLPSINQPPEAALMSEARASCILVVRESQLVGVFTQTDAVRLIASGRNLASVNIACAIAPPAIALTPPAYGNVFTALSLLRQHQIRHLPVLDDRGQVVGLVTFESICQALPLNDLLKSHPLAEVMSAPVIQAPATTSMLSIAQLMAEHQVNCVVLRSADSEGVMQPVGIVTEQDIIMLQTLELDWLQTHQAQTAIAAPFLSLSPSNSVLLANWEMQQRHVQRVVVSENGGELLGIVTPTSFLQRLDLTEMFTAIQRLQQTIDQLEVEKAAIGQKDNTNLEPQGTESPAELLEQLERNRILTKIALRIRESLNLDEILNTAVTEVRQFLQTDRVLIYRFNADLSGTVVVESVAQGWQSSLGSIVKDNCFGRNYAQSYKEGRVQVTEDIYTAGLTQCHIDILALFDVRANLVVPIVQGEKLWGLLCAYHCSGPRLWREFEVDLLKQLATQIAIAIQQSELYEQLQAELGERKRAEEQLKASLKEKEVLLKEIHHRVKNNLQIISSLLRMQSGHIKEQQAIDMFKDSQNRIRAMALIHEKLYQSKNLSKIDFVQYVRDLTLNLLRSYNYSSRPITLKTTGNDILLDINTAIPCGLIINELVLNSIKHAFTVASEYNEICIEISLRENQITLTVSDNGIGFPLDLDFQNTDSLGLDVVCTLTEQLEGTIELDRSKGTIFKITFFQTDKKERSQ